MVLILGLGEVYGSCAEARFDETRLLELLWGACGGEPHCALDSMMFDQSADATSAAMRYVTRYQLKKLQTTVNCATQAQVWHCSSCMTVFFYTPNRPMRSIVAAGYSCRPPACMCVACRRKPWYLNE